MNEAGKARKPFLFAIDFEMTKGFFLHTPLSQQEVLFDIKGISNIHTAIGTSIPTAGAPVPTVGIARGAIQSASRPETTGVKRSEPPRDYLFEADPEDYNRYRQRFSIVMDGLKRGDSYLTNLTIKTPIQCSLSLEEIFRFSRAPYKLYLPGRWVCFSPEGFVRLKNGKISTFPMKGTIDARLPNAREIILNDPKESAEHNTIVDLLRNDLSRVASDVRVVRFRYTDELETNRGSLLQVSSEIEGNLPDGYLDQLGSLFFELLPAGSVSGAPKESTQRIIREAEAGPRGFYTGVAGYFDGEALEAFVLIRFIEQQGPELYFRSGGGITANSDCRKEYDEAVNKVYLACFWKPFV